ncbi:MAG: G1 family glutamic endopeptidase [Terriglobales bacterium]
MQNQNWQKLLAVATVTVLIVSFTTLAVAQRVSSEDRNSIFASAAKDATNIKGVSFFAAPPKSFDPLKASNRELLGYGLPQRPDASDVKATAKWERMIVAAKHRADPSKGVVKPFSSREMMPSKAAATSDVDGTVSYGSYNWSGIANFNTLTKWNTKTSFDEVVSYFNVPVAQPPFGACNNNITGPFYQVAWNGIDGAFNGDVVQGGSLSAADCFGDTLYEGWTEWYPSYAILAWFYVNPGDDFVAVTYGAPGTDTQTVFIEDITLQTYASVAMGYVTGPGLVGKSAEYIVERPCCDGDGFPLPLTNYIFEFMGYNWAYDAAGTLFYPGNTGSHNAIFTMVDDGDTQDISLPLIYGTAGNAGRYSIMFEDENCAYVGGCTPD